MGIMDMFRSNPEPQSGNFQQVAQDRPNHTGSTPTPPPDGKMVGTDQGNIDPLAVYAKMFDKATAESDDVAPSFQLDPKVLAEVSSKLNFTQDIPPDLMQQAMAGDSNALVQIINLAAQSSYKAALSHTSTLTDKFVGARTEHGLKNVGSKVKQELTNSALSGTPNYNHPVVKRQLNMVAESLSAQHPDATPQEIAGMAAKYIQDLAQAISPQAQQQAQAQTEEHDWAKYLS